VQILKENGEPGTEGDLPGFGKITKIAVKEREEMGCVRRLCITYEKGSAELLTEYNTRYVLGSAAMQVTDQEGNAVDMALLPSACCMAKKEGKTFRVYGGGYGHGLGMCQNGANGMAKEGMRYTEILGKFYHEISIENIYNGKEE
jgi:stage II sporulation protein D